MSTSIKEQSTCTVIHRNTHLNKPSTPRDMPIKMNEKHSAILNTYNAFIDNLIRDENWLENRAHKENRLVTCGLDYQLSASRYFLFEGTPYTFTVELQLTDKMLKPNMVTLTLGQRAHGEASKSFNTKLLSTMMTVSAQEMTDFINARIAKILKRFRGQKITPFMLKTFVFDFELIESRYLAEYWENISDIEVIAYDGFSNDSKFCVSFKSDGLPQTKWFYLYEYLIDIDMKRKSTKSKDNDLQEANA